MGQISTLSAEQQRILDQVAQTPFFCDAFYFTGGTALSSLYLHHRESVDLDFFSEQSFNIQTISSLLLDWSSVHSFTFQAEFLNPVYVTWLKFPNGKTLKVDFARYPYRRLEKGTTYQELPVDSLLDIAVNKILTITQRAEVKDFVDLYFLLQQFSVWDLREGVRIKFKRDIEPMVIGSDFLLSEDFTFLPTMHLPLTLDELKAFFREEAKKLGKIAVE